MAQVTRKIIKKRGPETMADFQALLDSNKDKMSEGDYLALCNGMKSMFEREEKTGGTMVLCKVRTLTHEVSFNPNTGYSIRPVEKHPIINLSKNHFDKVCEKIRNNQMVEMHHDHHHSTITLHEGPCGDDECDCNGCDLSHKMEFQRVIHAPTYITYVYPKESWERSSELSRQHVRVVSDLPNRSAITYVFDD